MLHPTSSRLSVLAVLVAAFAFCLLAPNALAASITVSRSPAPPSAVLNDGAHSLSYSYSVSFTTTPELVCTQIIDPSGNPVAGSETTQTLSPTTASPYSSTGSYTVTAGLAPGRYLVDVAYYSVEISGTVTACPADLATDTTNEALVQAQFGVAASTGTITVEKFDDLNGSGVYEPNDPLVPNFDFSVTAPNFNFVGSTNYAESTDAGGEFVLSDVPAGPNAQYTISEVLPDPNTLNWAPTTGDGTQVLTLTSGENKTLLFANVQLTSLCGNVYEDTGRVGKFASGQPGVSGVIVTLGGTTGTGAAVAANTTQTTDANGNYCFDNLYPGTYSVSEGTPPSGLDTETDIDGTANGANYIDPIAVTSGMPSTGNNFLLVPPLTMTTIPQTKLCLTKHVNHARVKQGQSVVWTLVVKNCGDVTADDVATTDPLLAGVTVNSLAGAKLVLGKLVWDIPSLAVGQSKTYRFSTRFTTNASLGTHINRANALAANAASVDASATTKVVALKRPPIAVRVTG